MASIVSVEQIKGLAAGSTPNTITVPTGQKIVGTDAGSIVAPGQILQRVITKGVATTHESTTSTTLVTSNYLRGVITAKESNSIFCIVAWHGMMHTQMGTIGYVNLERAMNGGSVKVQTGGSYDGSSYVDISIGSGSYDNMYFPLSFHYSDSPNATAGTQITYASLFARQGGSNAFYFIHNHGPYYFEITEIAQ